MRALQILALATAFALTAGNDPAAAAGNFTPRSGGPTRADCISTDGKRVCECGFKCWADANNCGCIKPPPPPAPDPTSGGPRLKR